MGAFLAPGITDGTPLSSAHDYKAKRGGEFFDVGQQKKSKGYKGHPWLGAKKCPHNKRKLTDGTPLTSAYTYKAKGGGRILRCGTAKKAKRLQGTPLA